MTARAPHRDRFRLILAALIGIALGALAIAAAVLAAHTGSDQNAPTPSASAAGASGWSAWRPNATGDAGAAEIADYIAPFYRLNASQQLALITPVSLTQLDTGTGSFTGTGLTVALSSVSAAGRTSLVPLPGQTVGYELCGPGTRNCAVPGTPTQQRELLLRREALQLALYTFRYLPRTDNVVVVLPPGRTIAGRPLTVSLLFLRPTLAPLLSAPVAANLATDPPSIAQLPRWSHTTEAELVSTVTSRDLFAESLETQQDGGTLLLLRPLPAQ